MPDGRYDEMKSGRVLPVEGASSDLSTCHVRSDWTSRPMRFHAVRDFLIAYATDEEPLLVLGATHGYSQLSCFLDADSASGTRRRRFDGDIDGAGTEGNQEKSRKLASLALGKETEIAAGAHIEFEIFVIPRVVDSECVTTWRDGKCERIAKQEFAFVLAIEINLDLPCLDVVRRIARDRDFCCGAGSVSGIFGRHGGVRSDRRKRAAVKHGVRKERRPVNREYRSAERCARGVPDRSSAEPAR